MKFSIIIPNYNGEAFIKKTIESLINGLKGMKIIVVDDASTDKSVDEINSLKNNRVTLIQKPKNGGFASAVNKGIRYCKEKGVKFVIVANSDINVSPKDCSDIVESFHNFKQKNLGVIGYQEFDDNNLKDNEDTPGFLFALRLSIINKVGYFDEIFFMYGEEQDFFRRVINCGFQIKQTGIRIKHYSEMSGSSGNHNAWLSIRNSIYLETKRKDWILIIRKILILFLIINRIYGLKNRKDNSFLRITRPGIIKGNIYLFKAIRWNLNKMRSSND